MMYASRSVSVEPSMFVVGASHSISICELPNVSVVAAKAEPDRNNSAIKNLMACTHTLVDNQQRKRFHQDL